MRQRCSFQKSRAPWPLQRARAFRRRGQTFGKCPLRGAEPHEGESCPREHVRPTCHLTYVPKSKSCLHRLTRAALGVPKPCEHRV